MNWSHRNEEEEHCSVWSRKTEANRGSSGHPWPGHTQLRTAWHIIIQASPEQTATQTLLLYSSHVE